MKLKVKIEDYVFEINIGNGLNDFVWIALVSAKLYGQKRYPNGNYLPICLKNNGTMIPPRSKICDFFKTQEEIEEFADIIVEIQQPNTILKEDHTKWFELAFGKLKNIMTYKFQWLPEKRADIREKEKQKGYYYKVRVNYKMFPEFVHEFNQNDYKTSYDLDLQETELEGGIVEYSAEIELPFGDVTPQAILCIIPKKDEETKANIIPIAKEINKINNERIPIPVSQFEMSKRIRESLKQAEEMAQKYDEKDDFNVDQSLSGLCPFTFDTLWNLIENNQDGDKNMSLETLDENVKEIIAPLFTENLNKIYEIFFQYTFFYDQPSDKKDELMISIQDLMHFLKFYQICPDSQALFHFLELYDVEKKRTKNFKLTLNLANGIKFPEFIVIILKAVHYLQSGNLISETENFAEIIKAIIDKMIKIDTSEEETNEFQKHMKYNMTLVTFIRENSEKLTSIFLNKLQDSIQISEKKYHMLREEIKSIILESGFKGDNIEDILNSCYHELLFDNYQGFEGIFYHEFLQCIQWISLVLISDESKDEEENKKDLEETEEGVEVLIEKLKYFLGQLKTD